MKLVDLFTDKRFFIKFFFSSFLILICLFISYRIIGDYIKEKRVEPDFYIKRLALLNNINTNLALLYEWQRVYLKSNDKKSSYIAKVKTKEINIRLKSDLKLFKRFIIPGEKRYHHNDLIDMVNHLMDMNKEFFLLKTNSEAAINYNIKYRSLNDIIKDRISKLHEINLKIAHKLNIEKYIHIIRYLYFIVLLLIIISIIMVFNILLRREASIALKESEAKFRSLAESTSDWVWEIDQSGVYTYVSPQIKVVLGYDSEELLGKRPFDFMPKDEAEKALNMFSKVVKNKSPITSFENIVYHKDGRKVILETRGVPIVNAQGGLKGFRGVDRDITYRKIAENELEKTKSYLDNVINSMPSVLIGIDKNGKIVNVNNEALRFSGISVKDTINKDVTKIFPQFKIYFAEMKKNILNSQIFIKEKIFHTVNNETKILNMKTFPLITNEVEGAVIQIDDVTEKVQMEEIMVQSEKMLSIGGLAAGMAHEINNPLASILQNLSVLENRLTGTLPANDQAAIEAGTSNNSLQKYIELRKIDKMIQNIRESGIRASEVVTNMLSFARKGSARKREYSLVKLINKTLQLAENEYNVKSHYDFRRIKVVKDFTVDDIVIFCEPIKIQQVFLNILRNSAEALLHSENVIANPQIIIRLFKENDMAIIEFEDNGPGLSENIKKRIFEPFFTTKDVGQGTGLGMSVSYFIITENHKGIMAVESEYGKWTRFVIGLPLKRDEY